MLSRYIIDKLQSVDILSIAEELGIKVKRNKCKCPFHEDKTPSLKFWPSVNGWKCYGCGAKGTNIDLVMKHEDLSFHDACKWIAERHNISLEYEENRHQRKSINHKPSSINLHKMNSIVNSYLVKCQGINSSFCRAIVSSGILSQEQLNHAAEVYHLGQTTDDGVIFWQIDQDQQLRDGKIMFYKPDCHRDRDHVPSWVSFRLKKKGELPSAWKADYCLFGLHLLGLRHDDDALRYDDDNRIIAIVESEKTAIICSELIPKLSLQAPINYKPSTITPQPSSINHKPLTITPSIVWLATGGMDALTIESLRPLVGYKVIVFPDTDLRGEAYKKWQSILSETQKVLGQPFYISNLLELHATEDQKKRKIDIADFIVESR